MNGRLDNKAEEFGGRAKEAAGSLTNDDKLRTEGKADQVSAGVKDKLEDVKETVNDGIDKLRNK